MAKHEFLLGLYMLFQNCSHSSKCTFESKGWKQQLIEYLEASKKAWIKLEETIFRKMKAKPTFLILNRLFANRRENAIFDHSYQSYNEEIPSIKLSSHCLFDIVQILKKYSVNLKKHYTRITKKYFL